MELLQGDLIDITDFRYIFEEECMNKSCICQKNFYIKQLNLNFENEYFKNLIFWLVFLGILLLNTSKMNSNFIFHVLIEFL